MAPVDLSGPAVANLYLSVARAMPVADHEMISQTVLHVADTEVVDVKDSGIPLAGAAVVDDDIFPATATHWCAVNGSARGSAQIIVSPTRTKNSAPETVFLLRGRRRLHSL